MGIRGSSDQHAAGQGSISGAVERIYVHAGDSEKGFGATRRGWGKMESRTEEQMSDDPSDGWRRAHAIEQDEKVAASVRAGAAMNALRLAVGMLTTEQRDSLLKELEPTSDAIEEKTAGLTLPLFFENAFFGLAEANREMVAFIRTLPPAEQG